MKNRGIFSLFTLILVIFGMFVACSDSSSSGPSHSNYTVSFEANGGSPAPGPQTITGGGKVFQPPAMTKTGYDFGGWYKEAACTNQWDFDTDTVTGDITLYAKWNPPIIVSGDTLYAKLQWLGTNAASNSIYILEIAADEPLGPQELSFTGKSNITIQLQGNGSDKTIMLSSNGPLFTIKEGVILILDKNLILSGKAGNSSPLVQVNSKGTLIMNQGAKITGNFGAGVQVAGTGTTTTGFLPGYFTMNGGEISGNTSSSSGGGGVHVKGGTFTMNGGEISGNTSSYGDGGGGVYVEGGPFIMDGKLYKSGGTFTMNGGEISGNTSSSSSSYGGGGGVSVRSPGTFTMNGGEISGNTAHSYGGGVYVDSLGTFTKSGGTITGYASDTVNGNVVKNNGDVQDDKGHAVYVYVSSSPAKRKENTAGPGDNLDSKIGGAMGGWDY